MGRKRLGEILLEKGVLRADGLERALAHARSENVRLGVALRELGLVSEERLVDALALALGLPIADVAADDLDWSAVHLLRPDFCEAHVLLPYAIEEGRGTRALRVAMADPLDVPVIDEIEFTTGLRVRPAVAGHDAIRAAIARWLRRDRARPAEGTAMTIVRAGGVQEVIDTGAEEPLSLVDEVDGAPPAPAARFTAREVGPAPAPAPAGLAERLARVEARQAALIRLLAARGFLGADELRRLLE